MNIHVPGMSGSYDPKFNFLRNYPSIFQSGFIIPQSCQQSLTSRYPTCLPSLGWPASLILAALVGAWGSHYGGNLHFPVTEWYTSSCAVLGHPHICLDEASVQIFYMSLN